MLWIVHLNSADFPSLSEGLGEGLRHKALFALEGIQSLDPAGFAFSLACCKIIHNTTKVDESSNNKISIS